MPSKVECSESWVGEDMLHCVFHGIFLTLWKGWQKCLYNVFKWSEGKSNFCPNEMGHSHLLSYSCHPCIMSQNIEKGVVFLDRVSLKVQNFFWCWKHVLCLWGKHSSTKGRSSKGKKIRDMYISVCNTGCRLTVCTGKLEFWNTWLKVINLMQNLLKESF